MKKWMLLILLLSTWGTAQSNRPPRKYFLEIIPAPENNVLWPADEIRSRMIRRQNTPAEWFTEKRAEADYVLRIADIGGSCRWTLLWHDRIKDEEIVVDSKISLHCGHADGDVLAAADKDFLEKRLKK